MNCPYCGAEIESGHKYCQFCGKALPEQPAAEVGPAAAEPVFTAAAAEPLSLKQFVNRYSPRLRKEIRSCWIILYVCAAITFAAQILSGTLPLDGILLAALALWMQLTYSRASAIVTMVYAVISVVLVLATEGRVTGWLILIAGIYSVISLSKAAKAYKAYRETGALPEQ